MPFLLPEKQQKTILFYATRLHSKLSLRVDPQYLKAPWNMISHLPDLLIQEIAHLDPQQFRIEHQIAIHRSATVEAGAILKPPMIIHANCRIGAHAYLRGGVCLGSNVNIGPSCEIKASVIAQQSAIAHLSFVGDSLIGSAVNVEAGAVFANHYNERMDKTIRIFYLGNKIETNVIKFGALVGDKVKIGANAVLSPGTILAKGQVVGRLELIAQETG